MRFASWTATRAGFSRWTWITLITIVLVSVYTDISRYETLTGEKYIPSYFPPGQADFTYLYVGASALISGQNPYTTPLPQFHPPFHRPIVIDNMWYFQIYPATLLLLYAPVAWWFGGDRFAASQFIFRMSLVILLGLGVIAWRLVTRIRVQRVSGLFALVAAVALTFHPGVQLCVDRGQSDMVIAVMCWGALLLFLKDQIALAWIIVVGATAAKGYPLVFAFSLGIVSLQRQRWWRAFLGAIAGVLIFIAPVYELVPFGLKGTLFRSDMYWPVWYNHGFKFIAALLWSVEDADRGRLMLATLGMLVTLLWSFRAWQRRALPQTGAVAYAMCAATTAGLATMIGFSALSISYNFILVLPGVFVLATSQERLASWLRLHCFGRGVLGVLVTLLAAALFLYRWGENYPLGGVSMVVMLMVLGLCALAVESPPKQFKPAGVR